MVLRRTPSGNWSLLTWTDAVQLQSNTDVSALAEKVRRDGHTDLEGLAGRGDHIALVPLADFGVRSTAGGPHQLELHAAWEAHHERVPLTGSEGLVLGVRE